VEEVLRVRTLREWDRLTVVPRFGFADPEDYYGRASVGPRLGALRVPALLVASPVDPMVPASSIAAAARGVSSLDLRWVERGGHVGFTPRLDLGLAGPPGLAGQLAAWLLGAPQIRRETGGEPLALGGDSMVR
jgi:predicted alpha/beta-fold hydrolase